MLVVGSGCLFTALEHVVTGATAVSVVAEGYLIALMGCCVLRMAATIP